MVTYDKNIDNSQWLSNSNQSIIIPSKYLPFLSEIARLIDNGDSLDSILIFVKENYHSLIDFSPNEELPKFVLEYFENMNRKLGIEGLYYITHLDNLPSIVDKGILSHSLVEKRGVPHKTVYNSEIVTKRKNRQVTGDSNLWDYANLYFQPRNPMLYSLIKNPAIRNEDIAIICIKKQILNSKKKVFIVDGNAASLDSNILSLADAKNILSEITNYVVMNWWQKDDGSKRKIMAECLIKDNVPSNYLQSIYVFNETTRDLVLTQNFLNIPVIPDPQKFFQPDFLKEIYNKNNTIIRLVKGDLFFSNAQTLTISVNCVGVMGKGLASTAKYRFPDVYVKYQDVCKKGNIKYGNPFLYKRESSIFDELYDEYSGLNTIENTKKTWFLLFPTKNHWRNKSDINGIEEGLKWLVNNYKSNGIKSLAIPALGCGQGGLEWAEIGKLMCKYFVKMTNIEISIYLPTEKEIKSELLTPEYLFT